MELKKSTLVCGALLGTIVMIAEPVQADPGVIGVVGTWHDANGGLYSGIQGAHTFGGQTTMGGIFLPNFTVSVTSGESSRPDYDYELTIDFANFALFTGDGWYWDTTLIIKDIQTPNPISNYVVKNGLGEVILSVDLGSDAGTIRVRNFLADFDLAGSANDKLIFQWNQIPAPGALALLGLAGVVGARRRRN